MANERKSVEHLQEVGYDARRGGRPARSTEGSESDETRSISEGAVPIRLWEASRFQSGQQIAGRFLVIRFIARGGMGEVYEVEDRFLQGVRVALKMILPEVAADQSASHRFEQEVLLARKVTHPNLCPIYEIFHCEQPSPPFLFLTMKLLGGETLDARLKRETRIDGQEAVEIFRQMVSGIGALHGAGVIHRDIKPKNVMLERSGGRVLVSIMDFGLARLREAELTHVAGVAGTPGYLAPEIVRGAPPSQAGDLFALGVLLHQVFTGKQPAETPSGMLVPAAVLASADVPASYTQAVGEFLSSDPERRCAAFARMQAALESRTGVPVVQAEAKVWTRRNFAIASGATACLAAGGVVWKRERIYDLMHPLPRKRFVALLGWPPVKDVSLKPMLMGLMEAISNELSRAEAFDHDLFVIPHTSAKEIASPAEMNEVRESLGANLVLATSGVPMGKELHVSLQVLDPAAARPLREKQIRVPLEKRVSLPEKAVRAAAALLDIRRFEPDDKRSSAGTDNAEALALFQAAEALRKEPNDTGLEAAIEKYKQAVDADSHYAMAHARLATAYCRLAFIKHDPAALALAKGNGEAALAIDPNLVAGYMALAWVHQQTGDDVAAVQEMKKALRLDPANGQTLVWQGEIYARLNRWKDAEDSFQRALQQRPNDFFAHDEFGVVLNSLGRYREALAEFRASSLLNPQYALARNNQAAVYLQLGKVEEAIGEAKESLARGPNALAAATLAAALRSQSNSALAIQYAKKATDLDAGDSTTWLELGDCYSMTRGHEAEARNAYAKAARVQLQEQEEDPTLGPGWIRLGLYEAKLGQKVEAVAHLAKGDALPSDDLDSQLYKARALALLGDRKEALATIDRSRKRGATRFQIESTTDFASLRGDLNYADPVQGP